MNDETNLLYVYVKNISQLTSIYLLLFFSIPMRKADVNI